MNSALHRLILDAFEERATDVFLLEDEAPRVRIEGALSILHPGPIPRENMQEFWTSCGVVPNAASQGEADVSWHLPGGGRVRVNLYHTLGRLAAAIRPIGMQVPTLTELGLPAKLFETWVQKRSGLILVTGPTGSGKSTTVASCLDWVNHHESRHIVTLEDPIEFVFQNDLSYFSQREIRLDSESFASGLRASLRQSPDVIFIGEIRDAETAITALHAAETGHLVISTLHSGSVVETLDRLCRLIQAESHSTLHLLASQLIGVVSQQLLPRVGGGLFPVLEYFQNEAGTRRWILENRFAELRDHLNKTRNSESCSLLEYLVASVQQGYIEPDTARSICPRPQDFDRVMRGITG